MFLRSEPWSACPNPLIQLVGSAAEALTSCKAHEDPFDLILLDYELSDGNADVSLPAIRAALGEFASVVMLSSASREPTLQQCLSLGADAYRVKPIFSSSLLAWRNERASSQRRPSCTRRPRTPCVHATQVANALASCNPARTAGPSRDEPGQSRAAGAAAGGAGPPSYYS